MNIFEQYTQRQGAMNLKDILNFSPLTRVQQKHLTRVYAALLSNIILAALGVYIQQRFLPFVSPILLVGLQLFSLWTLGSSSTDAVYSGKVCTPWRAGWYGVFGLTSGMLLGDYLLFLHLINPSILPTAFLVSVGIFASLSAAAVVSKDRKFIYLGSLLGTGLTCLASISFISMFWRTKIGDDILLWGGLAMYIGYVLFDTQVALEMCRRGSSDFLMQAIQFYIDLLGIFTRIAQILAEKDERRKRRNNDDTE
ncbi:bax inhibitor-1 [Cystoisospora suis]|uniref:Bax inhibitor-1 n=1 Tax=Cystoisospora suis TaxID=483139 RepID=A0A2C6KVM2_9APIC|nr:bax inhibitor-1 [Cystoisospora suis]